MSFPLVENERVSLFRTLGLRTKLLFNGLNRFAGFDTELLKLLILEGNLEDKIKEIDKPLFERLFSVNVSFSTSGRC